LWHKPLQAGTSYRTGPKMAMRLLASFVLAALAQTLADEPGDAACMLQARGGYRPEQLMSELEEIAENAQKAIEQLLESSDSQTPEASPSEEQSTEVSETPEDVPEASPSEEQSTEVAETPEEIPEASPSEQESTEATEVSNASPSEDETLESEPSGMSGTPDQEETSEVPESSPSETPPESTDIPEQDQASPRISQSLLIHEEEESTEPLKAWTAEEAPQPSETRAETASASLFEKTDGYNKWCPNGHPPTRIEFESFSHGDEIDDESFLDIVKISAASRKPGVRYPCTGPLRVLDSNGDTPDDDLVTYGGKMMVYDAENLTGIVNDCPHRPGPRITFKFTRSTDITDVLLWDNDDGETQINFLNHAGNQISTINVPQTADKVGAPVDARVRGVKTMVINLGGSGGIVSVGICGDGGSDVGDPHIYTLDGQKYDLYENGTFSVFHYSGRNTNYLAKGKAKKTGTVDWQLFATYGGPQWTTQGLLLVDNSSGVFRGAMELMTKDCQWRSKASAASKWTNVKDGRSLALLEDGDFMTGFEFVNEKHLILRMNTMSGLKDIITVNTICMPEGINTRITVPDIAEGHFITGQIQHGNGRGQHKYRVKGSWHALGGSHYAADYFLELKGQPYTLLAACTDAQKSKAEKICEKHLGEDVDSSIFDDCIFDVCRGGEKFAIAAAEMMSLPDS